MVVEEQTAPAERAALPYFSLRHINRPRIRSFYSFRSQSPPGCLFTFEVDIY